MLIAVSSDDIQLCNQLAVMCNDNGFNILFINDNYEFKDKPDCIVLDLDNNVKKMLDKC